MNEYDIGSKLREMRLARNLTLRSVAQESGFSISLLSQIEKNKISPALPTLAKLARFFGVKMSTLFVEKDEGRKYEIIRKDDRKLLSEGMSWSETVRGYSYKLIANRMRNKKMIPILKAVSEKPQGSQSFSRDAQSFLFVLRGELNIMINNRSLVLEEGDSIYFDTSLEHKFYSSGSQESVFLEVTAGQV